MQQNKQMIKGLSLTEREVTDSIIASNFIIDYGFISSVSADKKLVDVKHIVKPTTGEDEVLQETLTKNVELLFPCSSNFQLIWDVEVGDGVILLGMKDYVEKIADKKQPEAANFFLHYKQETLKAIPFGFNDSPKTKITIKKTEVTIESQNKLQLKSNVGIDMLAATEAFVKGTTTKNNFDDLLIAFKTHTHAYEDTPVGTSETSVPSNAASMTNPISNSTKIKGE
jgi:hypothetical protein